MKLRRLALLRYGHLTDVELVFPPGVALHVVHGANEAGKSTALAAIADALFGFPHHTAYDFLHLAPQLRIGVTLEDETGAQAAFIRRKGVRDTLLDADGQPVPDEALRRFLGGADRALFERGFGLDGARLRQGARELQASGGEAGGSLLAGSGLLNLRGVLKNIDDQAKALFGDGRGRRRLSEALDRFRQARDAAEERAILPRAWKEQEDARAAAAAALADVQARTRDLNVEAGRLERHRRVAPMLAALALARDRLASLADAMPLPPDTEDRRRRAEDEQRDARRDADRETADAERLAQARTALLPDEAVLAAQDALDALEHQRVVAQQAERDLPGIAAEASRHRARVLAALADLPAGLTPEAASEAVPSAGQRQRLQHLINRHATLAAEAEACASADIEKVGSRSGDKAR